MKSAFLVPVTPRRPMSLTTANISPHPLYDAGAVSTFVGYYMLRYWEGIPRQDVELFATIMAIFWNVTTEHDASIFFLLWVIGGTSEFVSKSFLAGGNGAEAEKFRVGVQLGGYMSFLLMMFDVIDILLTK